MVDLRKDVEARNKEQNGKEILYTKIFSIHMLHRITQVISNEPDPI